MTELSSLLMNESPSRLVSRSQTLFAQGAYRLEIISAPRKGSVEVNVYAFCSDTHLAWVRDNFSSV